MKKGIFVMGLAMMGLLSMTSCSSSDSKNGDTPQPTPQPVEEVSIEDSEYDAIINQYVDNVVLPTYSDLKAIPTTDGYNVSFTLTNTSAIDAEEVAQVYVTRPESHIERPLKELKGFQRIALKAAERKTVTIPVRKSDLCHWDESAQAWMYEPDKPVFYVGGSPDKLSLAPMQ